MPTELMTETTQVRIAALVKSNPGLTIRELASRLSLGSAEMDVFYRMLVHGELFIDLANEPIAPNFTARVFPTEEHARASKLLLDAAAKLPQSGRPRQLHIALGSRLRIGQLEGHVIEITKGVVTLQTGAGQKIVTLSAIAEAVKQGEAEQLDAPGSGSMVDPELAQLDDEQWLQILKAYKAIEPFLGTQTKKGGAARPKCKRHHYRLLKAFREQGLKGLVHLKRSGNTVSVRMAPKVRAIMDSVIDDFYMSKTAPNIELVIGEIARQVRELTPRLTPPSRRTVYTAIKARDARAVLESREGGKRSYALASPVWTPELDQISVNGEHAWSVGHIDHTQIDDETAPTADGLNLERPWMTVLVLPRYPRIVAVWLSYEPPSYRACLAIIRECVRRHLRVPSIIVVDGGKEFQSVYFDRLLAALNVTKKVRPPARARFGSVLERLNCTITSKLFHNLDGNTKLMKNPRSVSADVNPKALAVYTLGELRDLVEAFCYEWLDQQPHPLLGTTPRQSYELDLLLGGERTHRLIPYSEEFLLLTFPTTERGTAVVRPTEGIRLHHLSYWCESFRDHRYHHVAVPVRYDPSDISVAYAHLDGRWVCCRNRRFTQLLKGLTEREIQVASQEILHAASTCKERRRAVSAESLAAFFAAHHAMPRLARLRAQAVENASAVPPVTDTSATGTDGSSSEIADPQPAPPAAGPSTDSAASVPAKKAPRLRKSYAISFSNE